MTTSGSAISARPVGRCDPQTIRVRRPGWWVPAIAIAGFLLAACSSFGSPDASLASAVEDGEGTSQEVGGDGVVTGTTEPSRHCSTVPLADGVTLVASDLSSAVLETSRRLHRCADQVVVAGPDAASLWTGARLAIAEGSAFLVAPPAAPPVSSSRPSTSVASSSSGSSGPGSTDPSNGDSTSSSGPEPSSPTSIMPSSTESAGAPSSTESSGGPVGSVELQAELERLGPESVTLVGVDESVVPGPWATSTVDPDPTATPPARPQGTGPLWLVRDGVPDLALALAPLALAAGASIEETGEDDLRRLADPLRDQVAEAPRVALIGPFPEHASAQLGVVRGGIELPGGGQTILPGRRYIAFYGTAGTSSLGVLGEQDPAATLERMQPLLAEYEVDDGVTVVPTFELIATVASSSAGSDGDYSSEIAIEDLAPYVEFAGDHGVYVLLDLQPGRTDFVTQVKRYEELLRLPHVGLALDPEWRLTPDQVHLRQFGSVDAAEVNAVIDWLSELVRSEALPQKMLLLHQFRLSMIRDRQLIEPSPELAIVVQMDGQGVLSSKYETLDALIAAGPDDPPWRWGWKNFYDEDTPMATPAQTLAIDPQPVYVSYQ